jgi:hypothetical protein
VAALGRGLPLPLLHPLCGGILSQVRRGSAPSRNDNDWPNVLLSVDEGWGASWKPKLE